MALKKLFEPFAKHRRALKAAPQEIYNRRLILSSLLYAMAALPLGKTLKLFETLVQVDQQV